MTSSRHQKIIGSFGENLLCNWLSRSGFEVALVDHTGIDVVAYNRQTGLRMGVSVKSRSRLTGNAHDSINILKADDREMITNACEAFACHQAWLAIYVETETGADLYLTSLDTYDQKYRGKAGKVVDDWKMNPANMAAYKQDPDVKHIRFDFLNVNWFPLDTSTAH